MRRALPWSGVLLVLAAVIPYLPTLGYGFVYDDVAFIERNERLETASIGEILFDRTTMAGAESYPGTYRPLRTFAFALDTRLVGKKPWFFHAANVFLHAISTFLLFVLLRQMLPTHGAAFYACLLFAIHPAAIEAVAWCSSRDNGLMLVFFLAALLLHRRARERVAFGMGAALGFGLALLSKEMAVTFPAIVLVHDAVARDRAPAGKRRVGVYAAYAAVLVGYLALRAHALGDEAMQRHEPWGGSWATSVMSGVTATGIQLVRCTYPIVPRLFAFDARMKLVTSPLNPWFLVSAALLACFVLCGVLLWRMRSRAIGTPFAKLSTFALWFLWFPITMLPVANALYPINILMADRFLYLPMVGPLALVGTLLNVFPEKLTAIARFIRVAIPIAFAVGFALVLPAWKDSEALWSRVLEKSPDNPRALVGLAEVRADGGSLATARDLLEHARRAEPSYWPAYEGGISVAARAGDVGEAQRIAVAWLEAATMIRPIESAAIAEKCVPVLRTLAKAGRGAEALELGRLLERAGATSRDFACLYAITLEASDLAGEAKRWRERCEAPQ